MDILIEHKKVQGSLKKQYGEEYNPLGLVFLSNKDSLMDSENFSW